MAETCDWTGRWNHVRKFLERGGPFTHPDFEPSSETLDFLQETCKILVIGAGGLGCELLKDLALMGFRNIHVIDMDAIDVSNLNRQFLFRPKDIGKSKADVAAAFINTRVPGCRVTPHFKKIQDFDEVFYRQFHIVISGLDNIVARRWINGMLISLLSFDDGVLDQSSIIPLVDGGTEGFKGNARVILPGITACIECALDLYPPQINFPLCTIAHTPRLPEHCIEYVRILLWPKEKPFGEDVAIDGDDVDHIQWIYEKSLERAAEFKISGVNYRLTQGVVKHIIPAVASTNAVIAAAIATEVFKLSTSCCCPLSNYMVFNDTEGIYTYTFEAERKENCIACSQTPQSLNFSENDKFEAVISYLTNTAAYLMLIPPPKQVGRISCAHAEDPFIINPMQFDPLVQEKLSMGQMKSPGVTTTVDGKNRTLYMPTVSSIEEKTRPNLKKTLKELGLCNGQELVVADVTTPNSLIFQLNFKMDTL